MWKAFGLFALISLSGFGGSAASAGIVTIDFGPTSPGAPSGDHVVLTNQLLAEYGVTFSTTDPEGVFWFGPGYAWPDARFSVAAGGPVSGYGEQMIDPIRVSFSTYASAVSVRGFDGGGDIDTLMLKAYDHGGNLVDADNYTDDFDVPGHVVSVAAPEIAYVTFAVSVLSNHGLFFDDLTYSPAAMPEPASVLIWSIGLGLAVAGAWLRLNRRAMRD